jgi:four helix bundle protein
VLGVRLEGKKFIFLFHSERLISSLLEKTNMNDLQTRLLKFSVKVSNKTDGLYKYPRLESILRQLNRSASSVGANYSEAQAASSRKDFYNKVRIALKEARESEYWLQFLFEKLNDNQLEDLKNESVVYVKILTVIARKTDPDKSH